MFEGYDIKNWHLKQIEKYKNTIKKLVVDKDIKEEILDKIDFYLTHGKITIPAIEKNNLYGKYVNDKDLNRANPAKEFLEIKIFDDTIICNYSTWSNRKIINITQNGLKGGNTRIYKKVIEVGFTYNNNNQYDVEEQEKIYNYQGNLVYDFKLEKNNNYDTYDKKDSTILYHNTNYYNNNFELERNWYLSNGSIIKYNLSKSFVNQDDKLFEQYTISSNVTQNLDEREYNFVHLDKELFKQFMTGNITIYDLLEKNKEVNKKLVKENKE